MIIFLPKGDLEKQFIISGTFELSLHFLPFHFVISVPAPSFQSHYSLSVYYKEGDGCQNLHTPVISVEAKGICMHVTNRTGGLGYRFLFKGIKNCSRLLRRRKKKVFIQNVNIFLLRSKPKSQPSGYKYLCLLHKQQM